MNKLKRIIYFCALFFTMIQRIQTLYLLLVMALSVGVIHLVSLWSDMEGNAVYAKDDLLVYGLFIGSGILALISILSYKNRQNQFVIGRLNIILNFALLGLFVYRSLILSGEAAIVSEKGIGMIIPVFSIVFIVLANKAIKRDEDLVKSVDRLR